MKQPPRVVAFGEALLRLSPPTAERLRSARELSVHVGGSEANVAVGLATLGLAARYYSRLPDGELGARVLGELRRYGVDVSYVTAGPGRLGLYFMEDAVGPRPARVTYDRVGSAFTQITEADAARALDAGLLQGAAALVTSGITLAVGEGPAAAAGRLWQAAAAAGAARVLDVNYRSRLASPAAAVGQLAPLLPLAEVVVVAQRDAELLYAGVSGLRRAAPGALLVVTRGAAGAAAYPPEGGTVEVAALPAAPQGRIGRGDAFLAGFLSKHLTGLPLERSLRYGVASASLKSTLAGDLPDLDAAEVATLAGSASEPTQTSVGAAGSGTEGATAAPDVHR